MGLIKLTDHTAALDGRKKGGGGETEILRAF